MFILAWVIHLPSSIVEVYLAYIQGCYDACFHTHLHLYNVMTARGKIIMVILPGDGGMYRSSQRRELYELGTRL